MLLLNRIVNKKMYWRCELTEVCKAFSARRV